MTYAEAIEYLYKLRWFGAKFGLANTFRLAELAGNPQQQLRFIHVAGTNGKGSTCAMLESIYREAGLRTGLFTSPHLVAFGERIQVNRQVISEEEIIRQVTEMKALLSQFSTEQHPTFFEVVTVMALRHFAAQKCEVVIWETGLGGRLDATNIVTPLASVITNIQYDHQQWLGSTLGAIAAEKAGIIKRGVPVITAAEEQEALATITQTASDQNAPLTVVTRAEVQKPPLSEIELPLLGEHQRYNAALAVSTVRVLEPSIRVGERAIRDGLSRVNWPGRLQLITQTSGRRILLDGAHNVAGAKTLVAEIPRCFGSRKVALVLGILDDKDWSGMCSLLAPLAYRILVVPVQSERAAETSELVAACRTANPSAQVTQHPCLKVALADAIEDPVLVIAGSLYLAGEALEILHLTAASGGGERGLNEWSVKVENQA